MAEWPYRIYTHFHLSGYVNEQNCRIWGTANPQVLIIVEKPMHPQRVTVWCDEDEQGYLWPIFKDIDLGNICVTQTMKQSTFSVGSLKIELLAVLVKCIGYRAVAI